MKQCLRRYLTESRLPIMRPVSPLKTSPVFSYTRSHLPRNIGRQARRPLKKHTHILNSKVSKFSVEHNAEKNHDSEEQQRIANLGAMTDNLKTFIPTLLQESLPKALLLQNILLRICPSYFEQLNSYLPNIKGHSAYYATCKAAQVFLTSFLLNPQTHLHIELIRTSKFSDASCVYNRSTKIFVRWSTCLEGCNHLIKSDKGYMSKDTSKTPQKVSFSTASAKFGSHRWSGPDNVQILDYLKQNWTLTGSIVDLAKKIAGITKDDTTLERIIQGVFVFELNEANDKIIVHTIENLNIVERRVEEDAEGKLRVC